MKEYSLYQHHHQLHHALHHVQAQPQNDKVLDLSSKRRDSTETHKTTSPSSFDDGSPDTRNSPNNKTAQLQLHHHHISIPKPPFTPEHAVQYHYKYDQTSPSTTSLIRNAPLRPSNEIFDRYEGSPILRKQEIVSPHQESKSISPQQFYHIRTNISDHHAEDSNDLPATTSNISSSSSTTSSQKSPSSSVSNRAMMIVGRDGKLSRPFKAFPRDPLSLAAAASMLDSSSNEKYNAFRKRALEHIHANNGGNPVINNPKMRRTTSKGLETNNNEPAYESFTEKIQNQTSPSSNNDKDDAYFERRKKNNAAAKKSRDRRRIKEDEIAIRAAFLQQENCELKYENVALKNENAAIQKQLAIFQSGLTSS